MQQPSWRTEAWNDHVYGERPKECRVARPNSMCQYLCVGLDQLFPLKEWCPDVSRLAGFTMGSWATSPIDNSDVVHHASSADPAVQLIQIRISILVDKALVEKLAEDSEVLSSDDRKGRYRRIAGINRCHATKLKRRQSIPQAPKPVCWLYRHVIAPEHKVSAAVVKSSPGEACPDWADDRGTKRIVFIDTNEESCANASEAAIELLHPI
eukprot:6187532-Pleurochrysis_carterae.AAC.1